MPTLPTPAAVRYMAAGEPRPPAPSSRTLVFSSLRCPAPPTSGRIRWRAYRDTCSGVNPLRDIHLTIPIAKSGYSYNGRQWPVPEVRCGLAAWAAGAKARVARQGVHQRMQDEAAPGPLTQASVPKAPGRPGRSRCKDLLGQDTDHGYRIHGRRAGHQPLQQGEGGPPHLAGRALELARRAAVRGDRLR